MRRRHTSYLLSKCLLLEIRHLSALDHADSTAVDAREETVQEPTLRAF